MDPLPFDPNNTPEGVPPRLAADLRRLHPEPAPSDHDADELMAAVRAARTSRGSARRRPALRRVAFAGIAAALPLGLAVFLLVQRPTSTGPTGPQQTARISGDINGDGALDILDALAMHRDPSNGADINGDGARDDTDAHAIAALVVKLDGPKPDGSAG